MELEDVISLEMFAESPGGLKRNGEMCFDAESLAAMLDTTRRIERWACAKLCDDKANAIGERANNYDDEEEAITLKALAWQLKVMGADIRMRSNV